MSKFCVIDANAYIHRAYHALPPLTTSKGEPVGAIYGFLRMVLKIIKQEKPDYIAVCFDYPAKTFRHIEFPAYKATREKTPDELKFQISQTHEVVRCFNIAIFEKEGYEADDLLATIAKKSEESAELKVILLTGDKDALQLVSENISVFNEQKNIVYTPQRVEEKYGVLPQRLVDVFALCGDSIDNIPGVPGIGEKTAIKLIKKYQSLDNIMENISELPSKLQEKLKNNYNQALLSKKLVTLHSSVPIEYDLAFCEYKNIELSKVVPLLKRFEFNRLLEEIQTSFSLQETILHRTYLEKENSTDCKTIFTRDDLNKLVGQIEQTKKMSLDIILSTDILSLSIFSFPSTPTIVGISISVGSVETFYIPLGHNYLGAPEQLPTQLVIETLKPVLVNPEIKKYGHNIKHHISLLRRYGVDLKGTFFDTMVASYCLDPSGKTHNLNDLSVEYLNKHITTISVLTGSEKKRSGEITLDKIEIGPLSKYSCMNANAVLKLAEISSLKLEEKKLNQLFYDIEMPLVEVLCDMEQTGIKVDVDYLKNLADEFQKEIEIKESEIYKLAGQKFNINSPKQLRFILFEKLKLPVVRKIKTGYSTDEEVLRILSYSNPLPSVIIEHRGLQKLKSTYIDALVNLSSNNPTQRVHTSFNQTVTSTGRLSSSEPNLQNIPVRTQTGRKIKRAFIPEDGHSFVSADYSQIDLRVLAHLSCDKFLKDAFFEGKDIHSATASQLFGDENHRRIAKTINFGIIYGMSAHRLTQQLGISQKQAQDYINNYFEKYSGVKKWIEEILEFARKNGYVTTLLGRIRYLPEINSKNGALRAFAERTAINTPVQGSSADIIKIAMINVNKKLRTKELKSKMLVQVHDELLFEVPEDELTEIIPIIKSEMEQAVKLTIPVLVDIKTGYNWADLKNAT